MSRSAPREILKSPATKFIKWNGNGNYDRTGSRKGGYWFYFDKTKGEKGEEVILTQEDLQEIVLLEWDTFSITGWNEKMKVGIWSNEVKSMDAILHVSHFASSDKRFPAAKIASGKYRDLIGKEGGGILDNNEITHNNAGFTKSIYAMWNGELVNFQLKGRTSFNIGDLTKNQEKCLTHYVRVSGENEGEKGGVSYVEALFEFGDKIPDDESEKAMEMDKELQAYLKAYFEKNQKGSSDLAPVSDEVAHVDAASQSVNTDGWRDHVTDNGQPLKTWTYPAIQSYLVEANETGDFDEHYDFFARADFEYQNARKTLDNRVLKSGKKVVDCSYAELKSMYDQLMSNPQYQSHESRLFIELEMLNKMPAPSNEMEEEDIPF